MMGKFYWFFFIQSNTGTNKNFFMNTSKVTNIQSGIAFNENSFTLETSILSKLDIKIKGPIEDFIVGYGTNVNKFKIEKLSKHKYLITFKPKLIGNYIVDIKNKETKKTIPKSPFLINIKKPNFYAYGRALKNNNPKNQKYTFYIEKGINNDEKFDINRTSISCR